MGVAPTEIHEPLSVGDVGEDFQRLPIPPELRLRRLVAEIETCDGGKFSEILRRFRNAGGVFPFVKALRRRIDARVIYDQLHVPPFAFFDQRDHLIPAVLIRVVAEGKADVYAQLFPLRDGVPRTAAKGAQTGIIPKRYVRFHIFTDPYACVSPPDFGVRVT